MRGIVPYRAFSCDVTSRHLSREMAKSTILVCNVNIESVVVFNPVATLIALSIECLAGNAISPKFTYNLALAPPLRKFLEETLPRLVTHTRKKDYDFRAL